MTKYIILLGAICTMALSGCYKEDPITAELGKYWRDYDVNSTDPAFKYVSEYWQKYDKVLLYDAEVRDYVYNFQQKNDVEIVNPTDNVYEKIQLFEKLFLKGYSDELRKEILPFNVIIAEKINFTGGTSGPQERDFYATRSFIAFKVTDADLTLDASGIKAKSVAMHKSFILDYCIALEKTAINPKFYEISKAWYSTRDKDDTQLLGIEKAYEKGLLYIESRYNAFQERFLTDYPSKELDTNGYFNLLLNSTDQELTDLRAKWPLINQKAGYYIDMLESLGIDYKQLK